MQVDAEFKLKDMKETSRLWEGKTEGCKRELKDLSKKLQDHIELLVPISRVCVFHEFGLLSIIFKLDLDRKRLIHVFLVGRFQSL